MLYPEIFDNISWVLYANSICVYFLIESNKCINKSFRVYQAINYGAPNKGKAQLVIKIINYSKFLVFC